VRGNGEKKSIILNSAIISSVDVYFGTYLSHRSNEERKKRDQKSKEQQTFKPNLANICPL